MFSPVAEVTRIVFDFWSYRTTGDKILLTNALDVVYNYGYFDFRTENFYFKFVKGDLQYFMNVTSFEDFIFEYQTWIRREVIEQTLNLPLN